MVDGPGGHGDVVDGDRNAGLHGGIGQNGRIGRNDGEIGPDGVVEQMDGDGVEHFGQAVDLEGGAGACGEKLDEVVG
jgi:hypothetical protein